MSGPLKLSYTLLKEAGVPEETLQIINDTKDTPQSVTLAGEQVQVTWIGGVYFTVAGLDSTQHAANAIAGALDRKIKFSADDNTGSFDLSDNSEKLTSATGETATYYKNLREFYKQHNPNAVKIELPPVPSGSATTTGEPLKRNSIISALHPQVNGHSWEWELKYDAIHTISFLTHLGAPVLLGMAGGAALAAVFGAVGTFIGGPVGTAIGVGIGADIGTALGAGLGSFIGELGAQWLDQHMGLDTEYHLDQAALFGAFGGATAGMAALIAKGGAKGLGWALPKLLTGHAFGNSYGGIFGNLTLASAGMTAASMGLSGDLIENTADGSWQLKEGAGWRLFTGTAEGVVIGGVMHGVFGRAKKPNEPTEGGRTPPTAETPPSEVTIEALPAPDPALATAVETARTNIDGKAALPRSTATKLKQIATDAHTQYLKEIEAITESSTGDAHADAAGQKLTAKIEAVEKAANLLDDLHQKTDKNNTSLTQKQKDTIHERTQHQESRFNADQKDPESLASGLELINQDVQKYEARNRAVDKAINEGGLTPNQIKDLDTNITEIKNDNSLSPEEATNQTNQLIESHKALTLQVEKIERDIHTLRTKIDKSPLSSEQKQKLKDNLNNQLPEDGVYRKDTADATEAGLARVKTEFDTEVGKLKERAEQIRQQAAASTTQTLNALREVISADPGLTSAQKRNAEANLSTAERNIDSQDLATANQLLENVKKQVEGFKARNQEVDQVVSRSRLPSAEKNTLAPAIEEIKNKPVSNDKIDQRVYELKAAYDVLKNYREQVRTQISESDLPQDTKNNLTSGIPAERPTYTSKQLTDDTQAVRDVADRLADAKTKAQELQARTQFANDCDRALELDPSNSVLSNSAIKTEVTAIDRTFRDLKEPSNRQAVVDKLQNILNDTKSTPEQKITELKKLQQTALDAKVEEGAPARKAKADADAKAEAERINAPYNNFLREVNGAKTVAELKAKVDKLPKQNKNDLPEDFGTGTTEPKNSIPEKVRVKRLALRTTEIENARAEDLPRLEQEIKSDKDTFRDIVDVTKFGKDTDTLIETNIAKKKLALEEQREKEKKIAEAEPKVHILNQDGRAAPGLRGGTAPAPAETGVAETVPDPTATGAHARGTLRTEVPTRESSNTRAPVVADASDPTEVRTQPISPSDPRVTERIPKAAPARTPPPVPSDGVPRRSFNASASVRSNRAGPVNRTATPPVTPEAPQPPRGWRPNPRQAQTISPPTSVRPNPRSPEAVANRTSAPTSTSPVSEPTPGGLATGAQLGGENGMTLGEPLSTATSAPVSDASASAPIAQPGSLGHSTLNGPNNPMRLGGNQPEVETPAPVSEPPSPRMPDAEIDNQIRIKRELIEMAGNTETDPLAAINVEIYKQEIAALEAQKTSAPSEVSTPTETIPEYETPTTPYEDLLPWTNGHTFEGLLGTDPGAPNNGLGSMQLERNFVLGETPTPPPTASIKRPTTELITPMTSYLEEGAPTPYSDLLPWEPEQDLYGNQVEKPQTPPVETPAPAPTEEVAEPTPPAEPVATVATPASATPKPASKPPVTIMPTPPKASGRVRR